MTTANLVDASVTAAKLSGAQTGSAPIYGCRAWVNFDGTLTNVTDPIASSTPLINTADDVGSVSVATAAAADLARNLE